MQYRRCCINCVLRTDSQDAEKVLQCSDSGPLVESYKFKINGARFEPNV